MRPGALSRRLNRAFWSLYGRFAWDAQDEASGVSEPPGRIVTAVERRRREPNERVLDAGCGTGNYALALARAGFRVVGVDSAAGMLARARAKAAAGLSGFVSFRPADLDAPLDFPDGAFDHVLGISVLQAVADPSFTLGEWRRVLKPGGTLILSLPKADAILLSRSWPALLRFRIRHMARRTPPGVLMVAVKSLGDRFGRAPRWTLESAESMLGGAGFRVLEKEDSRQLLVAAEKAG